MPRLLNSAVRFYLRNVPVTEGKGALLRATKRFIAPNESDVVAETKHGFRLRLNLKNHEHERIYYYGEHDERYETALLKLLIQPGWNCWDIGANIGYYSCLLSRLVGPTGQVVAFEPASVTRARLLDNLKLNAIQNVRVLSQAVGSAEGNARIYYGEATLAEGTASMYGAGGSAHSEVIAVTRLDTIAPQLPPPDFLKIDVEGAQLDVWRGGKEFFLRAAPLVLAELRDSKDPAVLAEIERTVRDAGYDIFSIHKRARVASARDIASSRHRNYALARPGTRAHASLVSRLKGG